MADVLLVHVREDETLADSIGISLERSGLTVARGESVFDVGDEVPCVIVLWSDVSTRSSMVRDVAIRAQREGKLVAASLGGCETPLGFARPTPHDLSEWGGDPDDPILDALFFAADRLVCAAKLGDAPQRARPAPPYMQRPAPSAPRYEQRPAARYPDRDLPERPLPAAPRAYEPAPAPAPVHAPASSGDASGRDLPPNLAAETLAWKQIENSKNPQDFLDYLGHFGPKGLFSELASMKLDKLTHKSKAPPKGSFIQHKPTPHLGKAKAPAPSATAQRRAEPARDARGEPPRGAEPRYEPRAEARPQPRPEARPEPRPEPRGEGRGAELRGSDARGGEPRPELRPVASTPRYEPRLSEIGRDTDIAPPRTRVSAAARRRGALPAANARRTAIDEPPRTLPWGAIIAVVVLGAGGIAIFQNLPKNSNTQTASSPPGFQDALRAAPVDDTAPEPQTPDQGGAPKTTLAQAAPTHSDLAKKAQKFAEAPPRKGDGMGGPIVTMAPRRDAGGGRATPPPAVEFHPVATAAPTPAAAPQPAPETSAAAAAFDPTTPAPTRYVSAQWIRQPGGSLLASFYPDRALDTGKSGKATLDCAILMNGKLNCAIQSEAPEGYGFGAAAMKASQAYLASPQATDGTMAYGAHTRLTISFK